MSSHALISAMKTFLLANAGVKALAGTRVCMAVAGQVPQGWLNNHALAISPDQTIPVMYPASWPNHTVCNVTIYAYVERFGEEVGLIDLLKLEDAVLDALVPDGNADFESFSGLVSACKWMGTMYPEAHLRNFEGLNEARIRFEYRF